MVEPTVTETTEPIAAVTAPAVQTEGPPIEETPKDVETPVSKEEKQKTNFFQKFVKRVSGKFNSSSSSTPSAPPAAPPAAPVVTASA